MLRPLSELSAAELTPTNDVELVSQMRERVYGLVLDLLHAQKLARSTELKSALLNVSDALRCSWAIGAGSDLMSRHLHEADTARAAGRPPDQAA